MRIYENILKQFIEVPKDILTITNGHISEVERFEKLLDIDNLVIGKVLTKGSHPDADKLSLTTVDVGDEILDIVCGAINVDAGQYVIVAKNGAILPGDFLIKPSTIRGIESNGMICSLNELGIDSELIPEEFKDGIYYFKEAKEVGTNALIHLGLDGFLMELDLTPNRSDLLSHYGFAKDLEAVINKKVVLPKVDVLENDKENPLTVKIKSKNTNSYYARYMDEIVIKESPMWLKNALTAMDCKPINNVVDITNYILYSYGIPMHAFDADKFSSNEIVIKDNNIKQTIETLDDQKLEINKDEILITNGKEAMALGGIMGLKNSMVTDKTTNIILEVASFERTSIQQTSKDVNLKSDSQLRFERGIDESLMIQAMNHATLLMQELAFASVYKGISKDVKKTRINPNISLDTNNINKLLGITLKTDEIIDILVRLNYSIDKKDVLTVKAPSYRNDINIEADVIEELARIYGVNNIENKQLVSNSTGKLTPKQKRLRNLRHLLSKSGFNEVITYSLLKEKNVKTYNDIGEIVSVLKPLTLDRKSLRQSLLNGNLETIKYNMDRSKKDIFIFEIGSVYAKDIERKHLSVMATGNFNQNLWQDSKTKVDFFFLKGILDNVMSTLNQTYELVESTNESFHPYQQGTIIIEGIEVGQIGKIHPRLNANDIYAFELNLDAIEFAKTITYNQISKYPNIERDLAVILKEEVKAKDLLALIKQTARKDLVDISIFDVYKGSHIEKGKQSIAVRMTFNNKDKTLKSKDIDKIIKKITRRIEIEIDGEIRS